MAPDGLGARCGARPAFTHLPLLPLLPPPLPVVVILRGSSAGLT
jgi:hypothetical protein